MNDGLIVFVAVVIALAIFVLSFEAGRSSVKDNCEVYGKVKVDRVILVCEVQK